MHTRMLTVFRYRELSKEFTKDFMSPSTSRGGGYGKGNFTPYMHIFVAHMPIMLKSATGYNIHVFIGEGTEAGEPTVIFLLHYSRH